MFYQLPHVHVSPIPSINPLPDIFPKESPPRIYDVSSHTSDELPTPIINVPTDTAPAMDHVVPSYSHALRLSHQVTTLPSHIHDFH